MLVSQGFTAMAFFLMKGSSIDSSLLIYLDCSIINIRAIKNHFLEIIIF